MTSPPAGRKPISFGLNKTPAGSSILPPTAAAKGHEHRHQQPPPAPSAAARAAFGGQEDADEAEEQWLADLCFPQQEPEGGDVARLASSLQSAAVVGDAPESERAPNGAAHGRATVASAGSTEASAAAKEARADALKARGNALAEAGDMAGALQIFESAISLLGPSTTARGHHHHHHQGRQGAKPGDEPSAVLWELKAQCHMQLEEWLEAVQAAERAVELSKGKWPPARHTLGRSLLLFGEVRAAVQVLTELYGADPSNEEVREDLIDANAALSELVRREQDFDLQLSGRAGLDDRELEVCRCKRNLLARGNAVDSDCTLGMDEEEEAAVALDRARREGVGVGDDVGMEDEDEVD